MKKPSPQFVSRLEEELRAAYRAQYQAQKAPHPALTFFKFFVPALSGALVLILILNIKGNLLTAPFTPSQTNPQTNVETSPGDQTDGFSAFNEGTDEEQIAQDFDNDELNQIDNSVELIANSNYE